MSTYGTLNADLIGNSNGQTGNAIGPGFKNRIINGDMRIDQRNAGASVTPTTTAVGFPVDRFLVTVTQNSKLTTQQSTTSPTGFNNSLLITSSSAYSVLSSDVFVIRQSIEGFNFSDLGFGTANAKTVTLSFWVRSSLTGTFGGSLANYAATRSYPFTYTISVADTWEYKTVTIAGDTSGTWVGASSSGAASLWFGLGVGSTSSGTAGSWAGADYRSATGATSVVGTNGATFYVTGVQLEVGSSATSFDYRPYGTELSLCYRYYEKNNAGATNGAFVMGYSTANNAANYVWFYKVTKRAAATISVSGATHFWGQTGAGSNVSTTSLGGQLSGINQTSLSAGFGGTSFTIGQGSQLVDNNSGNSWIAASAEL